MYTFTHNIEDKEVKCVLGGHLDTMAAKTMANDIQPLLDNADKKITIDCSTLEFISSSGLRLLLAIRKETIAKGGDVVILGLSDVIKKVFVITGFSGFFTFA